MNASEQSYTYLSENNERLKREAQEYLSSLGGGSIPSAASASTTSTASTPFPSTAYKTHQISNSLDWDDHECSVIHEGESETEDDATKGKSTVDDVNSTGGRSSNGSDDSDSNSELGSCDDDDCVPDMIDDYQRTHSHHSNDDDDSLVAMARRLDDASVISYSSYTVGDLGEEEGSSVLVLPPSNNAINVGGKGKKASGRGNKIRKLKEKVEQSAENRRVTAAEYEASVDSTAAAAPTMGRKMKSKQQHTIQQKSQASHTSRSSHATKQQLQQQSNAKNSERVSAHRSSQSAPDSLIRSFDRVSSSGSSRSARVSSRRIRGPCESPSSSFKQDSEYESYSSDEKEGILEPPPSTAGVSMKVNRATSLPLKSYDDSRRSSSRDKKKHRKKIKKKREERARSQTPTESDKDVNHDARKFSSTPSTKRGSKRGQFDDVDDGRGSPNNTAGGKGTPSQKSSSSSKPNLMKKKLLGMNRSRKDNTHGSSDDEMHGTGMNTRIHLKDPQAEKKRREKSKRSTQDDVQQTGENNTQRQFSGTQTQSTQPSRGTSPRSQDETQNGDDADSTYDSDCNTEFFYESTDDGLSSNSESAEEPPIGTSVSKAVEDLNNSSAVSRMKNMLRMRS